MLLNMHGTQYGNHSIEQYYKTLRSDWLCNKQSKYNVKCPGSRYVALP